MEPVLERLEMDGTPYNELIMEAVGRRVQAGKPLPTMAHVPNPIFASLVRQLRVNVEHGAEFSWFHLDTPWCRLIVRYANDIPVERVVLQDWESERYSVRFTFENFNRIHAYETFELMERVATELMDRAAQLRNALEKTVAQ